jgi:predicted Zn-dependent protease
MIGTRTPPNELFARAHGLFDAGEYDAAAPLLAELAADLPDDSSADTLAVRLLLARAYYHSAQLHRAEAEARAVLAADPANAYAHLLLGRTLQRQSRHADAAGPLRIAAAMGADR